MNKQIELIPENWEAIYKELSKDIENVFCFAIVTVNGQYFSGDYGVAIVFRYEPAIKAYGVRLEVLNSNQSSNRLLLSLYMGQENSFGNFRDCLKSATQKHPELEGAILHFKRFDEYPLNGKVLYGASLFD